MTLLFFGSHLPAADESSGVRCQPHVANTEHPPGRRSRDQFLDLPVEMVCKLQSDPILAVLQEVYRTSDQYGIHYYINSRILFEYSTSTRSSTLRGTVGFGSFTGLPGLTVCRPRLPAGRLHPGRTRYCTCTTVVLLFIVVGSCQYRSDLELDLQHANLKMTCCCCMMMMASRPLAAPRPRS